MENNNSKTVFVTICGRPNVGKSTILNALLGKKISIVSPKAQTTRVRVTGVLTKDDCQYVFLDTPGMHRAKSGLGQAMVQAVSEGIEGADITLFVVEAGDKLLPTERGIIKMLKENKMRAFLVINKTDTATKEQILETITEFSSNYEFEEVIPISARKREGLDILLDEALDSVFEEYYKNENKQFLNLVRSYSSRSDESFANVIKSLYKFSRSIPDSTRWLKSQPCDNCEFATDILLKLAKFKARDVVKMYNQILRLCKSDNAFSDKISFFA